MTNSISHLLQEVASVSGTLQAIQLQFPDLYFHNVQTYSNLLSTARRKIESFPTVSETLLKTDQQYTSKFIEMLSECSKEYKRTEEAFNSRCESIAKSLKNVTASRRVQGEFVRERTEILITAHPCLFYNSDIQELMILSFLPSKKSPL